MASAVLAFAPRKHQSQGRFQSGVNDSGRWAGVRVRIPLRTVKLSMWRLRTSPSAPSFKLPATLPRAMGGFPPKRYIWPLRSWKDYLSRYRYEKSQYSASMKARGPSFNLDRTLDQIRSQLGLNRVAGCRFVRSHGGNVGSGRTYARQDPNLVSVCSIRRHSSSERLKNT